MPQFVAAAAATEPDAESAMSSQRESMDTDSSYDEILFTDISEDEQSEVSFNLIEEDS